MVTDELVFYSLIRIDTALATCDSGISALAAVSLSCLTRNALGVASVRVQTMIDRLTMAHAQIVTAADRAGVWAGSGARNMADWSALQTKTSYGDANDRMRLGDAADSVPELADAVAAGQLSAKSATALHPAIKEAAHGADTAALVQKAKGSTPREAAAAGEKFRDNNRAKPETPEEAEERRYRRRSVRSGQPDDGMVTSTVVLPVVEHRKFINAISHLAGTPCEGDQRTTEQRLADGLTLLCDAYAKGDVNGGRERPTILLVIDADTMSGDNEHDAHTANADRVPAHVARRMAENAHLQRVIRVGSQIIDLGRTARLASESQYRALVVRDQGCRWPGCHIPSAWCEIDHLEPFPAGPTNLANLVMWCSHHHHEKHRPGVVVRGNAHDFSITLANGTIIHCPTTPVRAGERSPPPRTQAAA